MTRFAVTTLFATMIAQSSLGAVPDESVLQQWRDTFKIVMDASGQNFLPVKTGAPTHISAVSDSELVQGKKNAKGNEDPVLLKIPLRDRSLGLAGADDCYIWTNGEINYSYGCDFSTANQSTAGSDYAKLVRLVEKACDSEVNPRSISVVLKKDRESRHVSLNNNVSVFESWHRDRDQGHATLRIMVYQKVENPYTRKIPRPAPNGLATPASTTVGVNEIDNVIQSGHFASMPQAQRIGSSGVGPASIKVVNDTSYDLNLIYEGTGGATTSVDVRPGAAQTFRLPAGSFRVLGRVTAPNVLPFVGNETYGPGDSLIVKFYIR